MMSHFRGCEALVKLIMFLKNMMFLFFFLGSPLMVSTTLGENPLAEYSSREDMVHIAGYGEEKHSTVTITGQVLCHACVDDHGEARPRPRPVSGASVAVFCGNSCKKRKSWARSSTDANGEFLLDLPSHLHAIPNIEKICHVNVLHLPKNTLCHPAFTGKRKGIKLSLVEDGVRTYTAQKIHLTRKPSQQACKNRRGKNEERAYPY